MANSSLTTSMDEQHAPITVHLEFPGYDAPQLRFCGGFGDIYHTTQQSVLRPVCIKCLRTGDESPLIRLLNLTHQQEAIDSLVKLKEQFEQEVEITVSLSTSRYVPVVYDRGLTKITISKGGESGSLDWPYAVMEWIDGDQLDVFLTADDGPWPSGSDRRFAELSDEWQHRLLTIFTEIARALKDAHKQGIAHLDVTARNVMLKDSREVKLIDWGLAQRIGSCSEGKKGVAASGWGSADCMPSEQDIAFPREPLGFAIDVYNLGSIGYFLLTGKQLYTAITTDRNFAAKEMQTQIQCQYYHQTFYEELRRSGAPAFWVDLITQCFQLLPQSHSNRYKTAGEVVDAIEIYLAEQDRRERDSENRVATFRMRARWSALAVFLFLAVLIATSWALVARTNELRAKDQAVAATNATLEAELESNCFQLQQQLTSAQANWFKGNRKKAKITALNVLSQLEAQVQAHPTHRPSRRLLACTYGNVGDMLAYSYLPNMKSFNEWKDAIVVFFGPPLEENARNALEEGLGYLDRAMTGLQELKADWPDPPDGFALDLALVHIDRSFVLAYLHCWLSANFADNINFCTRYN